MIAIAEVATPIAVLGLVAASMFGLYLVANVVGLVFGAVGAVLGFAGALVGRAGLFVGKQVQDALHLAGALVTGAVIAPLAGANAAIGRFGNARHYGRAFGSELLAAGGSLYRVSLGNPLWLLGLSPLTEGLERRVPALLEQAPGPTRRKARGRRSAGSAEFPGYTVTGELEPGGSGARLFLAQPDDEVLARYRAAGHADPGRVVLKCFDVAQGSTVPQIVRESRSLEAARSLGLVLDHDLEEGRFWYAMPYVPGEGLDVVTRRLHARSEGAGLDATGLTRVLGYARDMLAALERFHAAGLWHKDIKPGNLIVSEKRAHLVDLGLVTPLASAMTLTTHGTEFFRDPELVRMAMKGARVADVDGVKFDLYSAGAVVYSMIENSFPAHGSLSRLEKPCPDALAFVVRRAMADLSQRYGSAEEMGRDLDVLLAAGDPWQVRPADLPSMGGARRVARGIPDAPERLASTEGVPPAEHRVPRRDEAPRPRRRGPVGAMTGAMLFLLMLGGLGVLTRTAWSRAREHGLVVHAELGEERAPSNGAGHLDRLGVRGRVLLLPGAGLDPAGEEQVENLRRLLRERGHELLGEGDDAASIELMARAGRAAGLSGIQDERALGRLSDFLSETPAVDALVWLGPGEEGRIGYRIVERD